MRRRILIALLVMVGAALAQGTYTVERLAAFIHSSTHDLKDKVSDKEVADFILKVKLNQKLDDATIEKFMADGAGPRTINALKVQRDRTANLPMPAAAPPEVAARPIPPPTSEEQAALIDAVREYALNYSQGLPDFVCLETARTYYAPRTDDPWQKADEILTKLAYFQQHETYNTISVNGKFTSQAYDKIRGSKSIGDFGSMLRGIFEQSSMTHFEWSHWSRWDGRRAMDFDYRVAKEHSGYEVGSSGVPSITTAYHGTFVVDAETHAILKLSVVAEGLPPDFPVRAAENTITYKDADIAGRPFLLPASVETKMTSGDGISRIEKQFTHYNKYSADATMTFGDVEPPPPPTKKK